MPLFPGPRMLSSQDLNSSNVQLCVRQQPINGLVTTSKKEKNRKALDPPPIIQLKVIDPNIDTGWLVSPYLFVVANLLLGEHGNELLVGDGYIIGASSSSLHRLKDTDNRDGGFFVFGDISIKQLGKYRLRFNLFNNDRSGDVQFITSVESAPFTVFTQKEFPGIRESSVLSRTFSDQGVRLRLRKEARPTGSKKRNYETVESTSERSQDGGDFDYNLPDAMRIKRQRAEQMYHTIADERFAHSAFPYGQPNMLQQGYGSGYAGFDQSSRTYQPGHEYGTLGLAGPFQEAGPTATYPGMSRLNTQRGSLSGAVHYPSISSQTSMDQVRYLNGYPTPTSANQLTQPLHVSHTDDGDDFARAQQPEMSGFLTQQPMALLTDSIHQSPSSLVPTTTTSSIPNSTRRASPGNYLRELVPGPVDVNTEHQLDPYTGLPARQANPTPYTPDQYTRTQPTSYLSSTIGTLDQSTTHHTRDPHHQNPSYPSSETSLSHQQSINEFSLLPSSARRHDVVPLPPQRVSTENRGDLAQPDDYMFSPPHPS
ncbi:hypothetical protein LTR62_003237 [Meristemomyces frigidus]|uniref:Velvet domain-containing protein n=1 Tax=Meristemomyces frigidus TaxID=1508187 RepID=A0AAN7YKX5_9PEZI|nr:hypothetical protein LTR62_003237 [Meristemomyces frigidus]